MCVSFRDQWYVTDHGTVLGRKPHQDVLWKFTIPWSERPKVLKYLDDHNLNALSLFASDEGLMETLALRELQLGDPRLAVQQDRDPKVGEGSSTSTDC